MFLDFMFRKFSEDKTKEAIIWRDKSYTYEWLLNSVNEWKQILKENDVKAGTVAIMEADFSPRSVALFLSLIECGCVLVPLTSSVEAQKPEFIEIAEGEISFVIDEKDNFSLKKLDHKANHKYYMKLRELGHPGLVLFSSGSTGKSKASVHDFVPLLGKFEVPRHSLRAITFLLYDHIGGVNTMLYTLSNTGCIVTVEDRDPESVFAAIEKFKVDLLPTSPTFLNLVLLSEVYQRFDTSSLKTVTYGTEPMPEGTLKRLHKVLPTARLVQTYGLSEVGILRAKSKSSDSLWVKVGGEGFEIKIVENILWIKAKSAMLGYLNAASPFTEDGWFITGDVVEQDGEYIRILGRKSEIINVGGEKVYPVEVENVLQSMDGVEDVLVSGESNPITGQIVSATIRLKTDESLSEFRKRMRLFCKDRLLNYKIPQKVVLVTEELHSNRFKKMRNR
jgi:acyl-coenzyme A synthetase/AMP-(fatty) acid ligase